MKKYAFIVGLALLMLPLVVPVNAAGLAKGKSGTPPFLKGNKIPVWDAGDFWVPADEPSYVYHGFSSALWKDLTSEEKRAYLDRETYVYELYIDGVQVDLRLSYRPVFAADAHDKFIHVLYSVQFDANEFIQGDERIFEGKYYVNGVLEEYKVVRVHFT